jgi:hypothetical protein
VRSPDGSPPPVLTQTRGADRVEHASGVSASDAVIPVPFEVVDLASRGAHRFQARDHRAVVRLLQLRRGDPQVE